MISLLSSWLRRELQPGLGSRRRLQARRQPRKPGLEVLEDRNLLSFWSPVPPMPGPDVETSGGRAYLAGALGSDGRVYAIGGEDTFFSSVNRVQAYNTNSAVWTTVAPMHIARDELAAATGLDGRTYALGGRAIIPEDGGSSCLDTVEAYNPTVNRWFFMPPMLSPRCGLAAVTGADGRIYAIGGDDGFVGGGTILSSVEAYSTNMQFWSPVASMHTPRVGAAAALSYNNRIYVFGGRDDLGNTLQTVESYNAFTHRWTFVADMPEALQFAAAARGPNGLLYVFGGFGIDGNAEDDAFAYDPNSDIWTHLPPPDMGLDRAGLAAVRGLDGRIYAIGGINEFGDIFDTVEALQGFGAGASASVPKSPTAASSDLTTGLVTATTLAVFPLTEATNQLTVPASGASDTTITLRHAADAVFAGGTDGLSTDFNDPLLAGAFG